MPGVNGTRGGRERAGKDHTSVDLGYRQQTVKCRLFFLLTTTGDTSSCLRGKIMKG